MEVEQREMCALCDGSVQAGIHSNESDPSSFYLFIHNDHDHPFPHWQCSVQQHSPARALAPVHETVALQLNLAHINYLVQKSTGSISTNNQVDILNLFVILFPAWHPNLDRYSARCPLPQRTAIPRRSQRP